MPTVSSSVLKYAQAHFALSLISVFLWYEFCFICLLFMLILKRDLAMSVLWCWLFSLLERRLYPRRACNRRSNILLLYQDDDLCTETRCRTRHNKSVKPLLHSTSVFSFSRGSINSPTELVLNQIVPSVKVCFLGSILTAVKLMT